MDVQQFATFNIAADPGQNWALLGAFLAIFGVIAGLYVQRRRLWIRILNDNDGTRIEIAALSRHEDVRLPEIVAAMEKFCRAKLGVTQSTPE